MNDTTNAHDDASSVAQQQHSAAAAATSAVSILRVWDYLFHGKLYNRSNELRTIAKSYDRMKKQFVAEANNDATDENKKTELIIIQGKTGTGKSTLGCFLRTSANKDGGYFVCCKFEQLLRPKPYSAFIHAFTEFSKMVVARGENEVARVRLGVEKLVKIEQPFLIEMIPALQEILQPTDDPSTSNNSNYSYLCPDASAYRFKHVFRLFINAISSKDKPIVMLFDDLHWADESSLDLLESFVNDSLMANQNIMYVGTYSRNDATNARIDRMLDIVRDDVHIELTDIHLDNFTLDCLNTMISEIFKDDPESTKPLADIVYKHSNGNVFFVLEYLRSLNDQNLLICQECDNNRWVWTIDQLISDESWYDRHLIRLIRPTLQNNTIQFLRYASCIGTELDEKILDKLMLESVTVYLRESCSCQFIEFDVLAGYWKFSHDCIKESIYVTILETDRKAFHYRIGRKLWRELTLDEIDHYIILIVNQLRFGIELMEKQEERTAVAKLCLRAGERSVKMSHFRTAYDYLLQAISLLDAHSWRDDYEFCLDLYNATAEVAYCNGDFVSVYDLVKETLVNARIFEHTIQAHAIKIYALGSSGRLNDAIDNGLRVLKDLGEEFPTSQLNLRILMEMKRVARELKGKTDRQLLELPLMNNPTKLAVMRIINSVFLYVSVVREKLFALMGLRILRLTLKYGQCVISSLGFIVYGICICGLEVGFRFGRLGLQIYENFNVQQWIGRVYCLFYGVLSTMIMPFHESIEPLKYAYLVSLEQGDIEYAFINGSLWMYVQFLVSSLPHLSSDLEALVKQMNRFGQDHNAIMLTPMRFALQDLIFHANPDPGCRSETFIDTARYSDITTANKNVAGWSHLYLMFLHYLFGHMDKAYVYAKACLTFADSVSTANITDVSWYYFYVGMVNVEHARRCKSFWIKSVSKCLKQLKKFSQRNPSNVLAKLYLLEAEVASFQGKISAAFAKYRTAIAVAKDSGFNVETALCNERTAKFLLMNGEEERSKHFFREALSYYDRWGSKPKVKHLSSEIMRLHVMDTRILA